MYAEPDLSFVRNVDVDMQRGYRCLYQNVDCQYDEDSPGSIDENSIDFTAYLRNGKRWKQVVIKSANVYINEQIDGINILRGRRNTTVLKTINWYNVNFRNDGFMIFNLDKIDTGFDYYVEILKKDNTSEIYPLQLKK